MSEKKLLSKVKQIRNHPHSKPVQVRLIRGDRQNIEAGKMLVETIRSLDSITSITD